MEDFMDDFAEAWVIDWSLFGIDMPAIAVPHQRLPTDLQLLDLSTVGSVEVPRTKPYGLFLLSEAEVVLCKADPLPDSHLANLRPVVHFNLVGPASRDGDLPLVLGEDVLLCAYSDVFLMSYVAENKSTDSSILRRLSRCSALGQAQTYNLVAGR